MPSAPPPRQLGVRREPPARSQHTPGARARPGGPRGGVSSPPPRPLGRLPLAAGQRGFPARAPRRHGGRAGGGAGAGAAARRGRAPPALPGERGHREGTGAAVGTPRGSSSPSCLRCCRRRSCGRRWRRCGRCTSGTRRMCECWGGPGGPVPSLPVPSRCNAALLAGPKRRRAGRI